MSPIRPLAFTLLALLPTLVSAAPPADIPITAQVQQLVDDGQYPDALKAIAKALPTIANDPAKAADRLTLFMLKGESLLQQKQGPLAAEAFSLARRDSKTLKDAAMPVAMETLIKRSSTLKYVPKAKDSAAPAGGYDIVDKSSRKDALKALFQDELAAIDPKIKAAKAAKNIPLAIDTTRALGLVRAIELAATDADAQTKTIMTDLATSAKTLMDDYLKIASASADKISADANQTTTRTYTDNTNPKKPVNRTETVKRGLTDSDVSKLSDIETTCDKIAVASNDLAILAPDLADGFKTTASTADATKKKAADILHATYGVTTTGKRGG